MFYIISIGDLCLQIAATIYYFVRWDFSSPEWSSEINYFSDFASFLGSSASMLLIWMRIYFVGAHLVLIIIKVFKYARGSYEKEFTKKYISQLLIGVIYVLCTSVRIYCTLTTLMWIT